MHTTHPCPAFHPTLPKELSMEQEQREQDQRSAPRVQFFNLAQEKDFKPVWVFRSSAGTAVLGLLLDISESGVQVLSDKSAPLEAEHYLINLQRSSASSSPFPTLEVHKVWSRMEGALYWRTGFTLVAHPDVPAIVQRIQAAAEAGEKWMRCELMPR